MAEDFFWSLKQTIDRELHSLSVELSRLTDDDLTDRSYLYYSRKLDNLQDLFDQISSVNKDLNLDQSNPDFYNLLTAKEELSREYGQYHRLRSGFFNRFSKFRKSREAEDFVRARLIVEQEPKPFIEEADELPEEEPEWEESDEYDPDAEKAEKNKERATRQKKLADEAKKRDARYAEQRHRQEEAARLGMNIREGQSLSEADIFRERVRQEEAQIFKLRQEEERRRSDNEAMRNYRERMERSQSFVHLDRQHIDMSREGIGPRGSEYVPPDTNFATPSDHSYTYSNPSEARFSQSPQRDSDTSQNPQQAFIPMQFTPTGVSPVAAAQHQWYQTAESNAKIYSALSTNRSELESKENPVVVSSAVEEQMRFNVDRARFACLEAQGTDRYQELVHNYIQERNSLSQFCAEVRSGNFRVEGPKQADLAAPPVNAPNGSGTVYGFTPNGVVGQTIQGAHLTGSTYEFSNPGIKGKPSYSVCNPMVVSSAYEEDITSKMRLATESIGASVSGAAPHTHSLDPIQTKMYTDAYLAFQQAKRAGTVVVDPSKTQTELPDYKAWQQRRQAPSKLSSNASYSDGSGAFVTGQGKGPNTDVFVKSDIRQRGTNIFNADYRLKQQSLAHIYASQIGSHIEQWSVSAVYSLSHRVYNNLQKGEDNALKTFEEGRYYFTTAAGVVLAIRAGAPTNALQSSVNHASSTEFLMFGTKSLMSDKQVSSALHKSMQLSQDLEPQIAELEARLAPYLEKMDRFSQANPNADKLLGLDKDSLRTYQKLSSELEKLKDELKSAKHDLNVYSHQQKLRHESKLDKKVLNSLESNGKLLKDPQKIRQIAESANAEARAAIQKKYGHLKFTENGKVIPLVKATDKSLADEILRLKKQGRDLKEQIKALEAQGANLSAADRKLLAQLKAEAKKLGSVIAPLEGLAQARADLDHINSRYDKIIKSAYKNRGRYINALFALQGFMLRALQSGYESNTEGLSFVIRTMSNRNVHFLVKQAFKASVFMGKAGLNFVAPGSVDAAAMAFEMANKAAQAKVSAGTQVIKSSVKSAVKTTVHAAGRTISSITPSGIKTAVNSMVTEAQLAKTKFDAVKTGIFNAAFRAKIWLANSKFGKGFSAFLRFSKDSLEVLGKSLVALKGVALKALAAFLVVFLLVGIISSCLGMVGGAAGGSIIASPFEADEGKIDLSPYMEIIAKEDKEFQEQIDSFINDPQYENVTINYTGDANNTKHMLSMMAVRMSNELDLEENALIEDYLIDLYHASHTYRTHKQPYNCSGCRSERVAEKWTDAEGKEHILVIFNEETQRYEVQYKTVWYCDGHIDLTVDVTVLTFDEIFFADMSSLGSSSLVGTEITEKVWNFLKAKGVSDLHAAAIMGNIQAESGFDPSAIEDGNGIGLGLCQWSFGRRDQLEAYAAALGKAPSDLLTQLNFFWMEYFPGASSSYADFQWILAEYPYTDFIAADSIAEATKIFCHGWERPGTPRLERRISHAIGYYSMYAGTDGSYYEPVNPGEEAATTAFTWNQENIDWCKTIYSMNWNELYSGVFEYGGVIESGQLLVKGDFMWPVNSTNITSPFGYRTHPVSGQTGTFHYGVDIGVVTGTPVHAAADGTVVTSTYHEDAGNYVVIDHADGVRTRYLHNSVLCVNAGDTVKQGEVIAYSGNTGTSTGPHLHFEFIVNGTNIDPCFQFDID